MLATIFSFFYITLICWSYGDALLQLFTKIRHEYIPYTGSLFITCFTGLAAVGILFTLVSLAIPLDNIVAQLLLLFPALVWTYRSRERLVVLAIERRKKILAYPFLLKISLFSCTLLILLMHSWNINHPDTLTYHAQSIQWVEKYRAIPGVANLHTMYGLQSSWFILCALFSFKFTGGSALTFINATVLFWFVFFIINKIDVRGTKAAISSKNYRLLWICLLTISFWSYTLVRLSATSGSPDFIAALYAWLIIYILIQDHPLRNSSIYLLLVFLGFFAITIKLQALPIVLLPLYFYYKHGKAPMIRKFLSSAAVSLPSLIPLFARNIISSGYLLFPSAWPDILSVDWKAKKENLSLTQQYITAYARTGAEFDPDPSAAVYHMNITDWLPVWWSRLSLPDKFILSAILLLLLLSFAHYRRIYTRKNRDIIAALLLLFVGCIFWFIKAPDPRFGYGILIPIGGILAWLLVNSGTIKQDIKNLWITVSLLLLNSSILGYSCYRFYNYFEPANFLQPAGITNKDYKVTTCHGIPINLPVDNSFCGNTPVPCTHHCDNIEKRGKSIEKGFRLNNKAN